MGIYGFGKYGFEIYGFGKYGFRKYGFKKYGFTKSDFGKYGLASSKFLRACLDARASIEIDLGQVFRFIFQVSQLNSTFERGLNLRVVDNKQRPFL